MLNWTSLSGGQVIPKVQQEHGAGIYQVDVTIQGTSTILGGLRNFVQPIKPFLILPEVTDPKAWLGGKLDFADEAEKINLVFALNTSSWVIYNPNLVNPSDITSFGGLLDLKWKGKIIWADPLQPGPGNMLA